MKKENKTTKQQIHSDKTQVSVDGLVNKLIIRGENKRECAEFVAKLLRELGPQTEMEKLLAEKIIFLWWKLRRLFEVERLMLTQQNEPKEKYDNWGNEIKKQRVRNLKNIKMYSPQMQEVIGQQIATEKALSKTLERYSTEQHRQD